MVEMKEMWKLVISAIIEYSLLFTFPLAGQEDIRNYNNWVNQAEIAIVEAQYDVAINCYNAAFLTQNPGFTDDFFNAFLVAVVRC